MQKWKKGKTVQKTYNSKYKQTDSVRTMPANSTWVYMESRLLHETETRTQDNTHNTIQTQTRTQNKKKYGSNPEECLQIFNDNVASGPVFICTWCLQTWCKGSVFTVEHIRWRRKTFSSMPCWLQIWQWYRVDMSHLQSSNTWMQNLKVINI